MTGSSRRRKRCSSRLTETLALGVEYDGSAYHGFQRQVDVPTVQAALEKAISRVADEPVRIVGAGRTDTGVHATQQVISFTTHARRDLDAWRRGVNSLTGRSIGILWAHRAPDGFSARFRATRRRYVYLITDQATRPAISRDHVTWVRDALDADSMHHAAQTLVGEHDFSAFRAAACQSRTPFRRVHRITVTRRRDLVAIDITANAFLLHMVRNVAGTLLEVGGARRRGQGLIGGPRTDLVARILEARDRTLAPPTAGPEGLYLVQVTYPDLGFEVPCRMPIIW